MRNIAEKNTDFGLFQKENRKFGSTKIAESGAANATLKHFESRSTRPASRASQTTFIYSSFKPLTTMKGLSILAAFLGGAAVGAACGILFAPERGIDTRDRIAEALRKRGIKLNRKEMEGLVDDIADELTPVNP